MCICIQRLLCTNIVQISGATGSTAGSVNGYYEPIDEIVGNATVYKKMGDGADVWVEYYAGTGEWFVKSSSSRGASRGWAKAIISPARPLEDCPSSCWEVNVDSNWVNQPSFSVSISSRALFEAAYAAEVINVFICLYVYMYMYICICLYR